MTAPALRATLAGVVLALVGVAGAQGGADGAQVYERNCVSCHGAQGGGGVGPALAENASLQDARAVLEQIRHGGGGMPAFADVLTDAEIVAVANHIRTSFGNDFGPVETAQAGQDADGAEAPETPEAPEPTDETGDGGAEPAGGADAAQAADDAGEGDAAPAGAEGAGPEATQEEGGEDAPGGQEGEAETSGGEESPPAQSEPEGPSPVTTTEEAGPATEGEEADTEAPDPDAAALYRNHCAACHGAQGGGGVGPALAGNATLADGSAVLDQILHGGEGMPAFEGRLSTEEIEAVARYVRTEFGNAAAPPATAPPAERGTGGDPGGAAPERAGEPGTAALRLRVEPADARLSVVGPPDFEAPPLDMAGGELLLSGIPAGGYTVVATLGGRAYRQLVDLDAGETATVTFRLEPRPSDGAAGGTGGADGEAGGGGEGP